MAAGLIAGLAACGHSAPPTEGADAGPSASDGGAPDAGATGSPDRLVIVAPPGSALCRRSDDGRALIVTVRNDGDDAIAATPIEVRTRDGGPALRHATPTLGAHQSVDLAFDRAPLIGYVPGWSFDVTIDPDGVARTRRGTCDDLRSTSGTTRPRGSTTATSGGGAPTCSRPRSTTRASPAIRPTSRRSATRSTSTARAVRQASTQGL